MSEFIPFRNDAVEKVTGTAKFCADFNMLGMLHLKTFWTEKVCAVVTAIDIAEAEKMPGVVRIITAKDITGTNLAAVFEPYDRPVLVDVGQKVQCIADAIALVVAETEEQAADAIKKIHVSYEPYEGIHTLEQAQKVQDPFSTYRIGKGDVEQGFAASHVVLEEEYYFPQIEHAYIEPESGHAFVDGMGVVNVVFGSQNQARHHRMICKSLGIPFNKMRLVSPYVGGGFGGKHGVSVQIHLALAAYVVRKPVKLVWTREESFFAGSKRHELRAKAKIGFSKDGKLKAMKLELLSPGGPYIGYSERTVFTCNRYALGPYYSETLLSTAKLYHTSNTEATAFRGFGATEGTFIIETLMDRAARKLSIDRVQLRLINAMNKEQINHQFDGSFWKLVSDKVTVREVLNKALETAGDPPVPRLGKKHGRGITLGMPMFGIGDTPGYKGTGADITMFIDGTVAVRIGFPEIGQGDTGVVTSILKEILGISPEKVSIVYADDHVTPKAGSLGFSQATVNYGNALVDASKKLKARLEQIAREILKTDQAVLFQNNHFYLNGAECISFEKFMDYCYIQGKNLSVSGWFEGPDPTDRAGVTFMAGIVDVDVDEETGEVEVRKVVNCHDVGKVLHYESARGQLVGGALMSIGAAMYEEYVMKDGKPMTHSFAEYLIPTSMDIPEENIGVFIEEPGNDCPLGAKGLGEHGLLLTPPAIANAILDAVGVVVNEFPITPEKLLKALNKI